VVEYARRSSLLGCHDTDRLPTDFSVNAPLTLRGMAKKREFPIDALIVWREGENLRAALRLFNRCGIVIRMAPPKLTKAEKLVNEQMLALLEWAADRPKSWHDLGKLPQVYLN
jgi:hypothetical protein